ncbi:MAG: DUF262 domain-containing protein [Chitinophagaceae bacterium]|nr:DUF262 domain-containing protein [Chitinophagaceae bacterium]
MKSNKSDTKETRQLKNIPVKEFIESYVYRIDLDADYQRELIWSRKQQLDLLDSIVKDIDIPKLYLVEVKDSKQYDYECIDGKQRMTTILNFFKPELDEENPLTVEVVGRNFTYQELKKKHPTIAGDIEKYALSFVIYKPFHDDGEFVRQIFRRLQLGVRLNTGELLKTRTGTIRDFIYKEIGNDGPFFRHTNLSLKRFSRPFTLAQICINSFAKANTGDFTRARYDDLSEFFEEYHDLDNKDKKLLRIKNVLNEMDKAFGTSAETISSRAIAVTGYLFSEELIEKGKKDLLPKFVTFFIKLLQEIKNNNEISKDPYKRAPNPYILENFQKYVLQASVENYSIKKRHEFLSKAFEYYRKTNGKIIEG